MLLLTFAMFLGTDILVKGRLAILSFVEIWTISRCEDDKQ